MLSEGSSSQKLYIVEFHVYEMTRISKSRETENRSWLPRAQGRKDGEIEGVMMFFLGVMKMF